MAFGFINRLLRVARSKTTTLLRAQVFDDVTITITSSAVDCRNYRSFLLYLDLDSTNTPTDILFDVEFSDDNVTFYKYKDGYFGNLRYEDTACASGQYECVPDKCYGNFMRLTATATGTTAQNIFTITAKIVFLA